MLSLLLFLVQQLLVLTPTRGVSRCVMTSAMDPVLPIASGLSTRTGGGEIVCNFVCGQTFSLSNKLLHGANQSLGKTLDCKTVDIATSFLPYKTFFPCFIEFKSLLFCTVGFCGPHNFSLRSNLMLCMIRKYLIVSSVTSLQFMM